MDSKALSIVVCAFLIVIIDSGYTFAYDQQCKVDKIYDELRCQPVYKSKLDKCPMK